MKTETLQVTGMSCASCAGSVESMLRQAHGVQQAVVNYASAEVRLQWDDEVTSISQLSEVLSKIGYQLLGNQTLVQQEQTKGDELHSLRRRMVWSIILSVPVFIQGMFFESVEWYVQWISMALTLAVLLYSGRSFYENAVKRLRYRQTNMDTLVALSTGIAFLVSAVNTIYPQLAISYGIRPDVYFESAAVIVTFVLLGKYFEEQAKHKSGEAIKGLMELQPTEVTLVKNGEEERVSLEQLNEYDRVVVKAGERIPVDGKVVKGSSYVNESSMTGEPIPLEKLKGMDVYAGTLNQTGRLVVLAERVGAQTNLSRIIEVVKNAQGSKAPAQKKADRLASIFVPTVLGIAFLTGVVWMLFGGFSVLPQAINSAVTVLVIACPCALGLATPTALMVGMGKAAEQGILIKDAEQLENFANITDVILDKTGTLTQGTPAVVGYKWFLENPESRLLLSEIEKGSDHPLAKSIVTHLSVGGKLENGITRHETVQGKGVHAFYKNSEYYVGNFDWIKTKALVSDSQLAAIEKLPHGASTVLFANDQRLLAVFALDDLPKPKSRIAIESLKHLQIEVHMLTGDNAGAAHVVAKQTGVEKVKASCLPADKAEYVKELIAKGRRVAMVGDGINDTQAMVQAQVSVAMGNGTDIAMDTAGITLLHGNLEDLSTAYRISVFTTKAINQNLFWAFAYNLVCIPIAAGILYPFNGFLLSPMVAGAAMAFSSLSVVLNSLRLKRKNITQASS